MILPLTCKKRNPINIICQQMYSKTSKGVFLLALLVVLAVSQQTSDCTAYFDSTNTTCTNCYSGYYLENNLCIRLTKACDINKYDVATGNCLGCYPGYKIAADGDCSPDIPNRDPHCTEYVSPICLGCSQGYYLDPNTGCTAIDPLCKNFTNNACVTCYTGYYLNTQNICTLGSNVCATFTNTGNGACATCWNGSVISGTTCVTQTVTVQSTEDPKCNSWPKIPCTNCEWGYFVNSANGCTKLSAISDCQGYNMIGGGCTGCPWGKVFAGISGEPGTVCIPDPNPPRW